MRLAFHRAIRIAAIIAIPLVPLLLVRPATTRKSVAPPPVRVVNAARAQPAGADIFEEAPPGITAAAPAPGLPVPVGIVGRLPDDAQAMVRIGGALRTLSIGDSAGEWTLSGIEKDRIRLRRGAEERTLVLPLGEPAEATAGPQ